MSNVPIQIRLADQDCAALDQYRRSQANPPTRPEAIRELLRKALALWAMCRRARGGRLTRNERPAGPQPERA
jgi:hypothetical protein